MSAGFSYNLVPVIEQEEKYDVQTGIRRRGNFILNVTDNLTVGSYVPSFAPICADLVHHTCQLVNNLQVHAAVAATDTTIQIEKGSFAYVGMNIGNGTNGGTISSIDKSNALYDVITLAAAFGGTLAVGDVLFEAKTNTGKNQLIIANSALYEREKIEVGINGISVALLRTAAEIEPTKLSIPFSSNDMTNLQGWFQFNA
jgi:hypothetical protein